MKLPKPLFDGPSRQGNAKAKKKNPRVTAIDNMLSAYLLGAASIRWNR